MCSAMQVSSYTNGLECLGHNLGAVVDSEDNIGDASRSKGLDLMLDHGLVRKLDKRLGVCEGLQPALVVRSGTGHHRGAPGGGGEGEVRAYERS
jgi:hypothetical protein